MENVTGKPVVVTGASSGLDAETVQQLTRAGAHKDMAIPADRFAQCVLFAISQLVDVDINEILFRPVNQSL